MADKDITQLEIKSNPDLQSCEKETTCVMNKDGLFVHSDHVSGIKWCVEKVKNGNAKIREYTIKDGKLVGIGIKTKKSLITFKTKPRGTEYSSGAFLIGG